MPRRLLPPRRAARLALCLATVWPAFPAPAGAAPGDLVAYIPFHSVAPQDITRDADGTWWITAFLDNKITHYDANLENPLGQISYPVAGSYPTGIAYNPRHDTLHVTDALSGQIHEIDKLGDVVGQALAPVFEPTPAAPSIRGMAFDPNGDGGQGSIYFTEASGGLVYELALDGRRLQTIPHPDTPAGFPARGAAPPINDVDLIFDDKQERITGYYLIGGKARVTHIRRLEADGSYHGVSVPLADSGGNVSAILRTPFRAPDGGAVDAFLCVVDSNARFALLEGGEPTFRELTGFTCTQEGRTATMSWTRHQVYERIEVSRGCTVLATLGGDSDSWSQDLDVDGVYDLGVRGVSGGQTTTPHACTLVVGAGQALRTGPVDGELPVDIASDGEGLLILTDGRSRRLLLRNLDFSSAGELSLNEAFAQETDLITGVAFAAATRTLFVFNQTQSIVGVFDDTGALLRLFPALLPNLQEDPEQDPDFGFVITMTHDASGDDGAGSLWLVELDRDWIYEIATEGAAAGQVLRGFQHPYVAIDPPPAETPFGIAASGISTVAGGSPDELYLTGGTLRDTRQVHLFRVNKTTGKVVPSSTLPLDGVRLATDGSYYIALESLLVQGEERLIALGLLGDQAKLVEMAPRPAPVQPPVFLTARQLGFANDVTLRFTPQGPYDRVDVFRDCELVATVPGDSSVFVDRNVSAGFHEYAIRGARGNAVSDLARASLQAGPGAVLERAFLWPALSPQQLAQDPVDGSYAVSSNWRGDEQKLYFYDRAFQFLGVRNSALTDDWEIATLAIRAPAGEEREINHIAWKLPVPLGQVDSQEFVLVKESLAGEPLGEIQIFPPRPTNGFITFPTGLTWRATSDTFYYLERNSKTFVEMSPSGVEIRTFPHPSPPFQNFVFNTGLTWDASRDTLFITGADRFDFRITRVMEMSLTGQLTGVEIPVGNAGVNVTDVQIRGDDLVAVGTGSFAEILRLKAFSQPAVEFLRGDADGNGVVNLTDVIVTLGYLFRGAPPPACEDAADADDSGSLNLTDAVNTLRTLFQGGGPLPSPFPQSGFDPTPDGLPCS